MSVIIFLTGFAVTMGGTYWDTSVLAEAGLIFLFCGAIGGVLGVNTKRLPVK